MRHVSLGTLLVFAPGSTPIFAASPVARNAASSAAVTTTVSTSAESRAALLADWDGSEDLMADRGTTISTSPVVPSAISEHTIANGGGSPMNIGFHVAPGIRFSYGFVNDPSNTQSLSAATAGFAARQRLTGRKRWR
jgi:hypothetical protein